MKYLDERIIIRITMGYPYPSAGIYRYSIFQYDVDAVTDDDEIQFNGNFYYNGSEYYYDFDVTDIVRNCKFTFPSNYAIDGVTRNGIDGNLIGRFRIKVYLNNNVVKTSDWETVAMVYRYPNSKGYITDGSSVFFEEDGQSRINVALQGTSNNNPKLIPHYPLKDTGNYTYVQSFLTSIDTSTIRFNYYQGIGVDEYYSVSTSHHDNYSATACVTLSDLIDWDLQINLNKDMKLFFEDAEENLHDVGVFDACPKRYYLMWQDRYGGFQSQAFNDYAVYSEGFETTETQNYLNERKKSIIQVQPKWKINSGWIKEEYFPIYESIFVSPFLVLYDSHEDKNYQVIINSDYTEKTYRDEKKMLNLNLDLEAISKQNIIY